MTYAEGFATLSAELRATAAAMVEVADRFDKFADESAKFEGKTSRGWAACIGRISRHLQLTRADWSREALQRVLLRRADGGERWTTPKSQ